MATRKRVRIPDLVEKLESRHGRAAWEPRFDPVSELISCVLSQHTTDSISFPTFDRLREMLPTWQEVVDAGPEAVAEIIKPAGLANQKARTIFGCLNWMRDRFGGYTLDPLREMPTDEARAYLESIPGVGPKTAAIVLCFALGRDVVPVDTHVYRVAVRLGLVPSTMTEAKAHSHLDAVMPPDYAFRFHMALIAHGREVCLARRPRCPQCLLALQCPARIE